MGECAPCPPAAERAQAAVLIPLQFVLVLLGCVFFLNLFARRLLTMQSGRVQPCFGHKGSLTAVKNLLLWMWGAGQTLAAVFSQTVADGSAPRQLAGVFAAFSALQFQGVAVAPACTPGSSPFQSLQAAAGFCFGVVAVGGACVAALALGRRAAAIAAAPPLLLLHTRYLLAACVALLHVAYGALVSVAVGAIACAPLQPILVSMYADTLGDGAAATAAFGRAVNMTILRAAARDPIFAQRAGLADVLSASVDVRLLAANPSIVCGEGPHAEALPTAYALIALLLGGFPVLVICALYGAGKLKGLQRALLSGACPCDPRPKRPLPLTPSPAPLALSPKGPPLPRAAWGAPSSAAAGGRAAAAGGEDARDAPPAGGTFVSAAICIFVGALERDDLMARAQWFVAYDWFLTALCTAGASFAAAAPTSGSSYLAYQLALAGALLLSAALVWWHPPHVKREQWQSAVQAALFFLAGATACANVLLRSGLVGGDGALALCAVLLLCAFCVLALLLYKWRVALLARGVKAAQPRGTAASGVLGRGGSMVIRDPDFSGQPPSPPESAPPLAVTQRGAAEPAPASAIVSAPVVFTANPLLGTRGTQRNVAPSPGRGQAALLDAYRNGAVFQLTQAARGLNLRRDRRDRHELKDEEAVSYPWAASPGP